MAYEGTVPYMPGREASHMSEACWSRHATTGHIGAYGGSSWYSDPVVHNQHKNIFSGPPEGAPKLPASFIAALKKAMAVEIQGGWGGPWAQIWIVVSPDGRMFARSTKDVPGARPENPSWFDKVSSGKAKLRLLHPDDKGEVAAVNVQQVSYTPENDELRRRIDALYSVKYSKFGEFYTRHCTSDEYAKNTVEFTASAPHLGRGMYNRHPGIEFNGTERGFPGLY